MLEESEEMNKVDDSGDHAEGETHDVGTLPAEIHDGQENNGNADDREQVELDEVKGAVIAVRISLAAMNERPSELVRNEEKDIPEKQADR